MSLIQAIQSFLESILNRNSPEVQKRLQVRKLENDLKAYQPVIFKNGNLLPNFAEAIRILYINTKPLNDLFSVTLGSPNVQQADRFEAQLVMTGFPVEIQEMIESISYENRKNDFDDPNMTTSQIFDKQHKKLDKIISQLSGEAFIKIDRTIISMHQLCDFCRFNFVTILQIFDSNYISADLKYNPSYQEIPVERLLNVLEDLYYVLSDLKLTNAMINAISALVNMKSGGSSTPEERNSYAANLKQIAYVLNHIISAEKLKLLIQYGHQDNTFNPKTASYGQSARKKFQNLLNSRFKADEQLIKTEMKDENIRSELSQLFGSLPLSSIYGYNEEISKKVAANTPNSFMWIMPLQIIKTFVLNYFTEQIRSLLNDIVIEGFFNNPNYKSEFSADVFAAFEVQDLLQNFENSFINNSNHSIAVIEGYIKDGKNNPDFLKRLDQTVTDINNEASKLITNITNAMNKLSKHVSDLLMDSKKPNSEIIQNLKVLMMSSRNRDNTDLLEQQFPKWEIFFKIMKNYAIIGT